jgi:hypothetical protein
MLKSRWKESGGKEEEEEFEVAMARKNGFTRNPFLRQLRIHFNLLIHKELHTTMVERLNVDISINKSVSHSEIYSNKLDVPDATGWTQRGV